MVVKSYRGLVPDGGQDKIRLTTTDGRTGYRIVKFELLPNTPGAAEYMSVAKVYRKEQSSLDGVIDFTDPDLLAAGYLVGSNATNTTESLSVIFDNEIFNQDIFVTHKDIDLAQACNYYIELEQIKLSTAQAELLIVKSLRGEVWTRP